MDKYADRDVLCGEPPTERESMINVCGECGFEKNCSHEEFMEHIRLHDEMDAMFSELGIEQEQMWDVRAEDGRVILEIPSW